MICSKNKIMSKLNFTKTILINKDYPENTVSVPMRNHFARNTKFGLQKCPLETNLAAQ